MSELHLSKYQLLDYRVGHWRILFERMMIEYRDSVYVLSGEQIHSVWQR